MLLRWQHYRNPCSDTEPIYYGWPIQPCGCDKRAAGCCLEEERPDGKTMPVEGSGSSSLVSLAGLRLQLALVTSCPSPRPSLKHDHLAAFQDGYGQGPAEPSLLPRSQLLMRMADTSNSRFRDRERPRSCVLSRFSAYTPRKKP